MHPPAPIADGSRLLPAPFLLEEGLGMVDVWYSLHASAEMVEGSDRQLLMLLKPAPPSAG